MYDKLSDSGITTQWVTTLPTTSLRPYILASGTATTGTHNSPMPGAADVGMHCLLDRRLGRGVLS